MFCLSITYFEYLTGYQSAFPSEHPSGHIVLHLSVYLSVHPSVCPSVCLTVHPSTRPSTCLMASGLPISVPISSPVACCCICCCICCCSWRYLLLQLLLCCTDHLQMRWQIRIFPRRLWKVAKSWSGDPKFLTRPNLPLHTITSGALKISGKNCSFLTQI